MLCSHSPLRRSKQALSSRSSYYLRNAANASSAHSVTSRRMSRRALSAGWLSRSDEISMSTVSARRIASRAASR